MKTIRKFEWLLTALVLGGFVFITYNQMMGIAIIAVFLVPAIASIYIPYAKDNPKHYWFKRKLYGWGWTPVTWQGWAVTLVYILLVVAAAMTIDQSSPASEVAFTFGIPAVLLTIAFIRIAYKKGESPKWQWGPPKNTDEQVSGR